MTTTYETLVREIAAKGLLQRYKANDYHVLSDAVLVAALEQTQALTRSQWNALLDSPATLRRLQVLHAISVQKQTQSRTAANDAHWFSSGGLLLAADSGEKAPSLSTSDHWWRLVFLGDGNGYRVVLQLDCSAPFAANLIDRGNDLAVVDGEGKTVMRGVLDDDGEMEAAWGFSSAPYAHFMEAGGRFEVRSC